MNSSGQHPDLPTLQAFALGKLSGNELEQVGEHVSHCDSCSEFLDRGFSDTLVQNLKGANPASTRNDASPLPAPIVAKPSFEEMQQRFSGNSRYELVRELGAGGMGAVYLANHSVMGRQVAIKVIRHDLVVDEEAVARFHQEVRAAAKLSHRNIVTAHDADEIEGNHFLVTEFVDGETLAQTVARRGPLSVMRSCNYILQAARGLAHAHDQGMIHRDIKPHNLMKTNRGVVKILDFGLARLNGPGQSRSELTTSGIVMGTADYIAPEQARDARTVDGRSDLYSLGCTLFFLLAGRPPYDCEGYVETIVAHCTETFPDISELRNDVPPEIVEVISRLTARDPEQRYASAKELVEGLLPFAKPEVERDQTTRESATQLRREKSSAIAGESVAGKPNAVNLNGKNSRLTNRNRLLFVGAAVLLLGGIVATIALFTQSDRNGATDGKQASGSQGVASEMIPRILIVISPDRFWFSDFDPFEKAAAQDRIELIVASSRTGDAQFNPIDNISGKHVVTVEKDIQQLLDDRVVSRIDAVVFIGDSIEEFIATDATGAAVRQMLKLANDSGRWIGGLGKGINIPAAHGYLNQVSVCRTSWLEVDASIISTMNQVNHRVCVDTDNKVVTAASWHEAPEFADTLITQLKKNPPPR